MPSKNRKPSSSGKHYVYIIQCARGTYYTGYTTDIAHRIDMHIRGLGAKYLRGRAPLELKYWEEHPDISCALKREKALQQLTHRKKEELFNSSSNKFIKF